MRLFPAFCVVALLIPVARAGQSAPQGNAPSQEQRVAEAEQAAIKALRAMNAAQASFQSACGQGRFYAPGLVELGKAPNGAKYGFLAPALSTAASLTKDGYTFKMASSEGAVAASPESCNGLPAGSLVRGYYVTAAPVQGLGGRYFGTNTAGTIFFGTSPLKMTDKSSDGTPLK